jgi:hypothetical protein
LKKNSEMKAKFDRAPTIAVLIPSLMLDGPPPVFELVRVMLCPAPSHSMPFVSATTTQRAPPVARATDIQKQIEFFNTRISSEFTADADIIGCILVADNWDTAMRIQHGLVELGVERAKNFVCIPRTTEDVPYDAHDRHAGMALRLLRAGAFGQEFTPKNIPLGE